MAFAVRCTVSGCLQRVSMRWVGVRICMRNRIGTASGLSRVCLGASSRLLKQDETGPLRLSACPWFPRRRTLTAAFGSLLATLLPSKSEQASHSAPRPRAARLGHRIFSSNHGQAASRPSWCRQRASSTDAGAAATFMSLLARSCRKSSADMACTAISPANTVSGRIAVLLRVTARRMLVNCPRENLAALCTSRTAWGTEGRAAASSAVSLSAVTCRGCIPQTRSSHDEAVCLELDLFSSLWWAASALEAVADQ